MIRSRSGAIFECICTAPRDPFRACNCKAAIFQMSLRSLLRTAVNLNKDRLEESSGRGGLHLRKPTRGNCSLERRGGQDRKVTKRCANIMSKTQVAFEDSKLNARSCSKRRDQKRDQIARNFRPLVTPLSEQPRACSPRRRHAHSSPPAPHH